MSKHTPGPWRACFDPSHPNNKKEHWFIRPTGTNANLAKVLPSAFIITNEGEQYANAQLIAAAPELFEALESLLKIGEILLTRRFNAQLNEKTNRARTAIAKAKGE